MRTEMKKELMEEVEAAMEVTMMVATIMTIDHHDGDHDD